MNRENKTKPEFKIESVEEFKARGGNVQKATFDDIEALDWEVEQKEIAISGPAFRLLFDEAQREVNVSKLIYSLTDVREKLCEKMGL